MAASAGNPPSGISVVMGLLNSDYRFVYLGVKVWCYPCTSRLGGQLTIRSKPSHPLKVLAAKI